MYNDDVSLMAQINSCANQYEYDNLIDKLFLVNSKTYNNKNSHEYSYLTARVLFEKSKKELSTDTSFY